MHRSSSRARILAGALLGMLQLPEPARAETAENPIDRGVRLRREGRDAEALEVFQRAYRANGSARAQAQVALAHQALGNWVQAEANLLDALERGGPWIEKNRPVLEDALGTIRRRLGTLEVVGSPPGATVQVNGRSIGTLPLEGPVRVVAGETVVTVSAPDHTPITRKLVVGPNGRARERVQLAPTPAGAGPARGRSPARGGTGLWFTVPELRTLSAELGYSRVPEASFVLPVASWFGFGARFGIDAALFGAAGGGGPGTLTTYVAAPFQFGLWNRDNLAIRLTFAPGLGLTAVNYGSRLNVRVQGVDGTGEFLAILLHTSLDAGFRVSRVLTVGGGLDLPITAFTGGGLSPEVNAFLRAEGYFRDDGVSGGTVIPILVGPTLEVAPTDRFRIGTKLRFGPHISDGNMFPAPLDPTNPLRREQTGVEFGFTFQLGVAFAL
jgi:hypothetical protein